VEKIKVLVADDEEDFLASLSKTLSRRGFEVATATDGRKALDMVSCSEFDVILLDLRMPVMDGFTALKEIRKLDKLTPVILLSGHVDIGFVTESLKEGAAEYLLKPCQVETIVSALETASERKHIAREVSEKTRKPPKR